ncbi:hypothetical protein AGMMS50262_21150 [Bacteroidia bacterium]|nr:hypothetical protein AGMMS50262_21150 [Bacteroidia bacterium]
MLPNKYSNTDSTQIIEYFDRNGRQIQNKDKVYGTYIYYNTQKYIDSVKYANKNNCLIDGVAQIHYEYNEKNECIKLSNYDKYGNPADDNNGITFYEYEYDDAGNLIRQWNRIIINGKLAIGERVMYEYSYNTDGNQEKIQLYNILYRAPYFTVVDTVLTEYGIAEYNYEYKNGNIVAEFYRDNHHNAMTDEYGIARYTYEYDKKGNQTKKMNYGIDNRPTENIYGIATYKWEYDKYGNNTKKSSYGIDGKLKENEDGVATYKWKYDSNGSMTEESFYGIDGKPVADKYVIATYKWEYDSNGNITKASYYNMEGKLTANQYGTATYKYEYSNNGNITKKSYYGSDGKFIHDGGVICRWEYEKYGNTTKRNWFYKNGKIYKNEYGVETYEWVYDDNGNMLEESYHDADGNLTTDTYGKAIMQWEYDDNGKITYESYWGIDRKPVINKYNSLAAIAYKYDEKQRMTEKKCYGINGLKENIDGFCMYKWEYVEEIPAKHSVNLE